jgi:hypothetical protein|nr:MAG TPA: hypothetical protein [Caudoviricetes sp.]DAT85469.1 MAG TPA: hypothetical protein [Bacteriophage sp.]
MDNLVEIVENQSKVISIQSGVISDLFTLLAQYMSADELNSLPQVDSINEAAILASECM